MSNTNLSDKERLDRIEKIVLLICKAVKKPTEPIDPQEIVVFLKAMEEEQP